jgi:dimethylargininase
LVTHIQRQPVDAALARRQHDAYCQALAEAGWKLIEVTAADDYPDGVFVEDTVVVCDDLAILTRPGAAARRGEVASVEEAVRAAGLDLAWINEPATLDGGDVLPIGRRVYVGRSERTNAEGIRQLRHLLATRDRTVVPVNLGPVLHLKSAVTALADHTVLARPSLVDVGVFAAVRVAPEESGAHVVPLDSARVLIAASAPRIGQLLADLGFDPVPIDISEFEKVEGCVTCLSVLIPDQVGIDSARS